MKCLYRYYHKGIRYTVEAESQSEADARFKICKRDRIKRASNPNRAGRLTAKRAPNVTPCHMIGILNGWDKGFALAMAGRKRITKRDTKGLSHTAATALRNGFFVATS